MHLIGGDIVDKQHNCSLAIKLNNSHHMLSTKPKLKTLSHSQVQLSKIIAKKLIKNGIDKQT
jgi:hypothetical protein